MTAPRPGRFAQLEAARGIAALVVVSCHFLLSFYPAVLGWASSTPLYWLCNGEGAVVFFFVLSGFVLSVGFAQSGDIPSLVRMVFKRWPRLYLPVLLAMLAGWAVLASGIDIYVEAGRLSGSRWLTTFGDLPAEFEPSLVGALSRSLGLFWDGVRRQPFYNPSLWSMRVEFIGSVLVFALCGSMALLGRYRVLLMVAGLAVGMAVSVHMVCFVAGMSVALVVAKRPPRLSRRGGLAALLMGLLLLGFEASGGLFGLVVISRPGLQLLADVLVQTAGATFTLIALVSVPERARPLSGRVGAMLGKLSFPIYLTHSLVLFTTSSAAFVACAQLGWAVQLIATILATIAGCLVAAWPLVRVEAWWMPLLAEAARVVVPGRRAAVPAVEPNSPLIARDGA